jgi:hypothetical protein
MPAAYAKLGIRPPDGPRQAELFGDALGA